MLNALRRIIGRTIVCAVALRGAFAERTIPTLPNSKLFYRYGGCDYAKGEASFEAEACDQGRRTGAGGRRVEFIAGGWRIRIGRADRGRSAE
jgi:hypothetical protein